MRRQASLSHFITEFDAGFLVCGGNCSHASTKHWNIGTVGRWDRSFLIIDDLLFQYSWGGGGPWEVNHHLCMKPGTTLCVVYYTESVLIRK